MWVLLLLVTSSSGTIISYDQGRYNTWGECRDLGVLMVQELGNNYQSVCIEWTKNTPDRR